MPENQARRLRFIGEWLSRYGDAIYATRALGLPSQPSWGYLTRSRAGDRIYCIVRRWPDDGRLEIPLDLAVQSAETMYSPAVVRAIRGSGATIVELGQVKPPDTHASVVVLHLQ